MGEDEVATLETLTSYRGAMALFIDRHRGRVVSTSGDGLLAEFESVVEAVQCAAEIQRELGGRNAPLPSARRMHFRIGINLGDVMIEGEDIFGEGVNVAARLQGLARPGGICISGTVYEQVKNKLTLGYEYAGMQSVKNIADPVSTYWVSLDAHPAPQAEAAPPQPSGAIEEGQSAASAGRTRSFLFWTARVALLLAILVVVDLVFTEGWWVHWAALVLVFSVAAKAIKVFGGESDAPA